MFDNGSLLRRRKRFKTILNNSNKKQLVDSMTSGSDNNPNLSVNQLEEDNYEQDEIDYSIEENDQNDQNEEDLMPEYEQQRLNFLFQKKLNESQISNAASSLSSSTSSMTPLNQMLLLSQNLGFSNNSQVKNLMINISGANNCSTNRNINTSSSSPTSTSSSNSSISSVSTSSCNEIKKNSNSFSIDSLINNNNNNNTKNENKNQFLKLINQSITIKKNKKSKKLTNEKLKQIRKNLDNENLTSSQEQNLNHSNVTSMSSRSSSQSRDQSVNSSRCASPEEKIVNNDAKTQINNNGSIISFIGQQQQHQQDQSQAASMAAAAAIRLRNSLSYLYPSSTTASLNNQFGLAQPDANSNLIQPNDQSSLVNALSVMSKTYQNNTYQQQQLYNAMLMRAACINGSGTGFNSSMIQNFNSLASNISLNQLNSNNSPFNLNNNSNNDSLTQQINFSNILPLFLPMHS